VRNLVLFIVSLYLKPVSEPPASEPAPTHKPMRPWWQIVLFAAVLWPVLYFGLAAILPGVPGRIAWIFRER